MYDFLKSHAIDHIWSNPEQDNQIVVAAQRITRPGGELISFPIMKQQLALPTKDARYHVFQIGQIHPILMNLLPNDPDWIIPTWKKFSDAVDTLPLFADLYTDAGVHLPLHRSYYMYTSSRALIFAIDSSSKSPIEYRNDQVYLRVYTNAFYESSQANSLAYRTRAGGLTIRSNADLLAVQAKVTHYQSLPGQVMCFTNGHLVDAFNFSTTKQGDVVEYFYDASVKSVVDFHVSDLLTFTSTLDAAYKYLLRVPGKGNQIDFVDDVDVYVLKKTGDKFIGRYLSRNDIKTLRMVTHQDYSLHVENFRGVAEGLSQFLSPTPIDLRDFHIRLYVRNGGMIRPLTYEHYRVFELYKLSEAQITQAMLGADATMPYWTADSLESSAYTELMRSKYREINIDLIQRAYGYNAISKVIGDTPIKTRPYNSGQIADLPAALYQNSTIYEYDANGMLLGFYPHGASWNYYPRHQETRLIEGVIGIGSTSPSVVEGEDLLPIPSKASYRVYMSYIVDGYPSRQWKDVTGTDHYTVENGRLRWQNLETGVWLMVRTDEQFLAYELEITPVAGTLYFDLSEMIGNDHRVMSVPMGDLDLWLNGKSLIVDLDAFVEFPRVYITNKEHLIQPADTTPQKITVRFTGFADSELKMRVPEDYGFVEHGFLSNNNRFDVRDDKVLRITLRGAVKHRDDIQFSEEHTGISVTNVLNGSPYQVKDVIVPLKELTEQETYALREASLAVDKAVEDYMTLKFPQPPRNIVNAIPSRYMLVSPFFSHLVHDLANKNFDMIAIEAVLSDNDVIELCRPYEPLLAFDPVNPENEIDHRYVVIHPTAMLTPIGLSLYSYRFLQRVVTLYGQGVISLSPHLNVDLGG